MKTFVVTDASTPLVTLEVAWPTGTIADATGLEGATWAAAEAVMLGTRRHGRRALMEALDRMGARVEVSAGKEAIVVRADVVARHAGALVALLAEVVAEPAFHPDEVDRLRDRMAADLEQVRDHDALLCSVAHQRHLWGDHPYGRPERGLPHTLGRLTPEVLREQWARCTPRSALVVGIAGRVTEAEAERFARVLRDACPDVSAPETPSDGSGAGDASTALVVDHPARSQAQVAWGQRTIACHHPDLLALLVANTAFGGTFTSLLTQEIREKRGWSYGASSALRAGRIGGELVVRYAPARAYAAEAIRLGFELVEAFAERGLDDARLEAAHRHLVNAFPFRVETAARRMAELVAAALRGLPDDYVDGYVERLRAVTMAQAREAARRHVCPDRLKLTVVGPADAIVDSLETWPRRPAVTLRRHTDYPAALASP